MTTLLYAAPVGAQQPPVSPYAVVVGAVADSIHGGPLSGAIVMISGTDRQATADSAGRFRIDSIPPGNHELGVFHPLLDSLSVSVESKNLPLPAGVETPVFMATPSATTVVAIYCSEADRKEGPAAVIGRVLAPESNDPIPNAVVRYSATWLPPAAMIAKGAHPTANTYFRDAPVRSTGSFVICGLPVQHGGTVHASRGQTTTGETPADVSKWLVATVTLRLDTLKRGTAVVLGRIVDDKGAPIAHADVALAGLRVKATTGDSGTFALRDLPSGSQTIQVRKVGFTATDTALMLSSKTPVQFQMTLHAAPPTLGTVNVVREAALQRVGFERRRQIGIGHYLTEDEIRKRGKGRFSDVARMIPGLEVRYNSSGLPVVVQGRGGDNTLTGCVTYLLDGNSYEDRPPGTIDGLVRSEDLIGLEVYGPSELPADLPVTQAGRSSCTLVVIWTRATSSK